MGLGAPPYCAWQDVCLRSTDCRSGYTVRRTATFFRHKVVPVVMGARRRDYEAVAPPHSFVHVDDFAGPRHLADYLHLLAGNATLYNEYFRWRETTWLPVDRKYWCRLCALLHWRDEVDYVNWYDDFGTWWNGACRRNATAPWFQRNRAAV